MITSLPAEILKRHSTKLQSARIYPDVFPLYPTDLILNLGCGKATQAIPYKGRFKTMYGIDLNLQRLQLAAETCAVLDIGVWHGCCSDVHRLSLSSNFFDACMAIDIIEHTLQPMEVLTEVYRVLKPKGRFLITFPAMHDSWLRLFSKLQHVGFLRNRKLYIQPLTLTNGTLNPDAHHQEKNVSEWINLTTKCGFKLNKVVASTMAPPLHRIGLPKVQYTNNLVYRIDRFLSNLPVLNQMGQTSICIFEKK